MLTSQTELEKVLRRPLTTQEIGAHEILDDEARYLIEGHLGGVDYSTGDVPGVVRSVAIRMVSRSLNSNPEMDGVASQSETNGPFTQYRQFVNNGGNLYIGKTERQMLAPLKSSVRVVKLANY